MSVSNIYITTCVICLNCFEIHHPFKSICVYVICCSIIKVSILIPPYKTPFTKLLQSNFLLFSLQANIRASLLLHAHIGQLCWVSFYCRSSNTFILVASTFFCKGMSKNMLILKYTVIWIVRNLMFIEGAQKICDGQIILKCSVISYPLCW